ncbi:MAG: CPBP family glutamic-type intramembrane protease [Kofleriaceae bacterium]
MKLLLVVSCLVACVTPRVPGPPRPPASDRYDRAASPDPIVRASATDELAFDPSPQATQMLLVLLRRDRDPGVRARAASAIEARRDTNLDSELRRAAAADPDPGARAAAATAYRRLRPWRKRPGTAAGLSLLCPGCGQVYLGDNTGYANLAATATLFTTAVVMLRGHEVALDGAADSAQVPIALQLAIAGQNLWFYSIFDAYRDARVARGDEGYKFSITRESLGELASAPFRLGVIKSPWVWAGVPLALAAGIGVSLLVEGDDFEDRPTIFDVRRVNVFGHDFHRGRGFAVGTAYFASLFAPVGVGEEALFRGLIQTELEERFGTVGGLVAASAIFGAVHITNFTDDLATAAVAVPLITVLGASLGLAYQRTGHKLSTSVAMHFWYDFLLSTVAFAVDPTNQPFVVNYSTPM